VYLTRFLLEHGADVTAKDDGGMTPLHWVVEKGKRTTDLACLLVDYGADLTAQDNHGWDPLHLAVKKGSMDLACMLFERAAPATTVISREDVAHVARLARLALTDAARERIREQLDGILAYIDTLRALDTSATEGGPPRS